MSASLKVPFYKTFWRVTVPVCLPAILDIGRYLFRQRDGDDLGGRVPVLAEDELASISILQLDEAGDDRLRPRRWRR